MTERDTHFRKAGGALTDPGSRPPDQSALAHPLTQPSSKTVEERLRSVADSISQDAAEVYDALMLGAKTLDILVSQFYAQHVGQCRIYSTNAAQDCSCGLREILHGEARPQDQGR